MLDTLAGVLLVRGGGAILGAVVGRGMGRVCTFWLPAAFGGAAPSSHLFSSWLILLRQRVRLSLFPVRAFSLALYALLSFVFLWRMSPLFSPFSTSTDRFRSLRSSHAGLWAGFWRNRVLRSSPVVVPLRFWPVLVRRSLFAGDRLILFPVWFLSRPGLLFLIGAFARFGPWWWGFGGATPPTMGSVGLSVWDEHETDGEGSFLRQLLVMPPITSSFYLCGAVATCTGSFVILIVLGGFWLCGRLSVFCVILFVRPRLLRCFWIFPVVVSCRTKGFFGSEFPSCLAPALFSAFCPCPSGVGVCYRFESWSPVFF
uniref:Transmembrane protein n=1 Tax=Knipowitschia caucasica TaxID=637954 RepID=A0AAV2KM34_KNICA